MASRKEAETAFVRGNDKLIVPKPMWAEILLMADKWGWQPSRPSHYFLAGGFEVEPSEATSLAEVIQRILDRALQDPLSVYPTPVDMAILYQVGEFCSGGAFTLR